VNKGAEGLEEGKKQARKKAKSRQATHMWGELGGSNLYRFYWGWGAGLRRAWLRYVPFTLPVS
jgi:hypothetical protein